MPDWLMAGQLPQVLADYRFPSQRVYALYPDSRQMPAQADALIDFFIASLHGQSASIKPKLPAN